MYGDNLFTANYELDNNTQRAQLFRAASLWGCEYALSRPEKASSILKKYAPDETNQKITSSENEW